MFLGSIPARIASAISDFSFSKTIIELGDICRFESAFLYLLTISSLSAFCL